MPYFIFIYFLFSPFYFASIGAGAGADSCAGASAGDQAQAIASKNPDVMAATATPEFYAEEVASNQDLVDNGVTEVKMVKAEFGQATVDGTTATITVYETWTTAFQDGTTDQSRDRNIYTLIQDNGTWKVKTDVHPDQPASTGAPGAPKPGTTGP